MGFNLAEWQPNYESGDRLIDEQHQSLFSIINALNQAMLEGQSQSLLVKTIVSLERYTIVHFDTEEEYMLRHHYPDYGDHKKKHEALKAKVKQFQAEFQAKSPSTAIALSHFLTDWLIQHIQKEDLRMIQYCRQQSQAPQAHRYIEIATWEPRYETGISLIDNQHKSLFHAINALNHAMLIGRGQQIINETLQVLKDYVGIHFETEESYMLKYDYPDYPHHRATHEQLSRKVQEFCELEKQQQNTKLTIEVSHFLTHWLIDHINNEDQKMINFFKSHPLPSS